MNTAQQLVESIVKGIQAKKGERISVVDLRPIEGAITCFFVICQGNSPAQVEAITESIDEVVRRERQEKPQGVIGLGNDQWVAMDYVDVLVHVFQPAARLFYDLENLWDDAILSEVGVA